MKCKKCKSENIITKEIVFVSFDRYRESASKIEYICQDCGNKGSYYEVVDDKKLLEEVVRRGNEKI